MAHFHFEAGVNECLQKLEAPITRGPVPRWQRKLQEREPQYSLTASSGPLSPIQPQATKVKSRITKTPSKTPSKTPTKKASKQPATPNCGDRFIPNRSAVDVEWGHYQLVRGSGKTDSESDSSGENGAYGKELQKLKEEQVSGNSRILRFKNQAPAPKEGYQNHLRVLYCQSKPTVPKVKATRRISQAPDRILDAPGLYNDFYLNLLDWGQNNLLGLALGGAVYIWNPHSGEVQHLFQMGGDDYVTSVSWTESGNILAVGNSNGDVQLWDVKSSRCLRNMPGHLSRVGALAWNSHLIASGSRSGDIHHHDVRVANHHIASLLHHTQEVCGLKWSQDGKHLASGGNDNMVNIWSLGGGTEHNVPVHTLSHHQSAVKALAWCPWQPHILASGGGSADRHICFWNISTGVCVNSIDTRSQVSGLLWSQQYKELLSSHGYSSNQLTIWKYPAMTHVAELHGHTSRVMCLSMSPDSQTVASLGSDETLRIWKCFEHEQKVKKNARKGSQKASSSRLLDVMSLR